MPEQKREYGVMDRFYRQPEPVDKPVEDVEEKEDEKEEDQDLFGSQKTT